MPSSRFCTICFPTRRSSLCRALFRIPLARLIAARRAPDCAGNLCPDRRPLADPAGDRGPGPRAGSRACGARTQRARLHRHALYRAVERRRGEGRQGLGSRQDRAAAALSAVLHHHHGFLAAGVAGGCGCGGIGGAGGAGVLLSRGKAALSLPWRPRSEKPFAGEGRVWIIGCCYPPTVCRNARF